jgi:membrane-anchored glycerophosphoryl diester phosphodiesterase (GDPDase)
MFQLIIQKNFEIKQEIIDSSSDEVINILSQLKQEKLYLLMSYIWNKDKVVSYHIPQNVEKYSKIFHDWIYSWHGTKKKTLFLFVNLD